MTRSGGIKHGEYDSAPPPKLTRPNRRQSITLARNFSVAKQAELSIVESPADLEQYYRDMLFIRHFEEKCNVAYRQGKVPRTIDIGAFQCGSLTAKASVSK